MRVKVFGFSLIAGLLAAGFSAQTAAAGKVFPGAITAPRDTLVSIQLITPATADYSGQIYSPLFREATIDTNAKRLKTKKKRKRKRAKPKLIEANPAQQDAAKSAARTVCEMKSDGNVLTLTHLSTPPFTIGTSPIANGGFWSVTNGARPPSGQSIRASSPAIGPFEITVPEPAPGKKPAGNAFKWNVSCQALDAVFLAP